MSDERAYGFPHPSARATPVAWCAMADASLRVKPGTHELEGLLEDHRRELTGFCYRMLGSPFDAAFVRLSPSDYHQRLSVDSLTEATTDPRLMRRAEDVFAEHAMKSFNVDLQDLSSDAWYLLPPIGDFLAEIETRRFDTLTYTLTAEQAEDISVFRRRDRLTLALYPSVGKLAVVRGALLRVPQHLPRLVDVGHPLACLVGRIDIRVIALRQSSVDDTHDVVIRGRIHHQDLVVGLPADHGVAVASVCSGVAGGGTTGSRPVLRAMSGASGSGMSGSSSLRRLNA